MVHSLVIYISYFPFLCINIPQYVSDQIVCQILDSLPQNIVYSVVRCLRKAGLLGNDSKFPGTGKTHGPLYYQLFKRVLNIWAVWQGWVWFFSSFDLGVVNNLCPDHCLRVDDFWFGTGLLSLLYGCLKYLGGLAITGLAFLFI